MYTSILFGSILVTMATAAGNEYLPPNKGYDYTPPNVPFPSNGNKQTVPPPRPQQPRPSYVPPPAPTGGQENHDHHHEPGMPFDFAYAVNENGNDFSHNANSDGDVTRGEYRVALPDGRMQIVKYTADWKNGFNAEVTYEGEATYPQPQQQQAGYSSGPASGPGQAYVPPKQGGGYQY